MESDEFYAKVRTECESWEKTEQGKAFLQEQLDTEVQKTIDNNKEYNENTPIPTIPKTIRTREFGDFYAKIIPIELELLEDYYLLFSVNTKDEEVVAKLLTQEKLNFMSKQNGLHTFFILFFDGIINRIDKTKVINLISSKLQTYIEIVDESIISDNYDPDLIAMTNGENFYKENWWTDYFYFKGYFETEDYLLIDKYNLNSLPTNHLEVIKDDNNKKKFKLTYSDKRIQVIPWN